MLFGKIRDKTLRLLIQDKINATLPIEIDILGTVLCNASETL